MMLFNILFYTFLVVIGIQFAYYGILFLKFGLAKIEKPTLKNIGVSVLVCAKNESENLLKFIPEILNQDFPKFELILINDDSNDDTLEIMESFNAKHDNIKIVDVDPIEAFWKNKKYPLTLGIKAATFNFLLLTDADCRPLSNQWIKEMSRHFSNEKTVILGYGAYKKIKNSFINNLIRFETVFTAMQYFSFAKIGFPYMGVGRNLAYRKETFFNANGFMSHMNIPSGDDDLFVNQVANSQNTALCYSHNSFTESLPETSIKKWFNQKRRHVSTARHYKLIHKLLLSLFYASQLLFWCLSIILLTVLFQWEIVLLLFVVRIALLYLSYGLTAKKLNELDTLLFLPILELFLVFMQLVIFISNLTSTKHNWR